MPGRRKIPLITHRPTCPDPSVRKYLVSRGLETCVKGSRGRLVSSYQVLCPRLLLPVRISNKTQCLLNPSQFQLFVCFFSCLSHRLYPFFNVEVYGQNLDFVLRIAFPESLSSGRLFLFFGGRSSTAGVVQEVNGIRQT